jgi:hypothetical protein
MSVEEPMTWRNLTVLPSIVVLLICVSFRSARGDDAATTSTRIDHQIGAQLDSAGLRRSPSADDAEFLRRAFLDLHGVVPSVERARRFLDSSGPGKRPELVEELLASPRFGEHFANLWQRRLISPLANEQRMKPDRFAGWLADRFNHDPWDRISFDLLTATGKMDDNPAVTYLIEGRYPLSVTALTDLSSRCFLGIRLNCAQCHDHPFAKWKQKDYWGMAAFFAQMQMPGRPKAVYLSGVQDNPKLTLASIMDSDMLEGFQSLPPTFLGGGALRLDENQLHRRALARWLTSSENPYFARAAVNRMWSHFFGRGIVNPVDDMHEGNLPSHPELLDALSRQFVESGFDLKFLCRSIVDSRTYQQTSRAGDQPDGEAQLFARMSIKVLSADQLYDSLAEILGPPGKTAGIDTRLGARHEFTQFFATDADSDATRYERGIPHVLRLMNSSQFAGRNISALVARISTSSPATDGIVDGLFLTILSRHATAAEQALVRDQLQDAVGSSQTVYRELAWALLLSSEFSLNH